MKTLVLLAHHDDEIFILPYLLNSEISHPLFVFVSTTNQEVRRKESVKCLTCLGYSEDSITSIFEGDEGEDGKLILLMGDVYKRLREIVSKRKVDTIITHMYEGGHPDHDSLAIISRKLFLQGHVPRVLNFPCYNSGGLVDPFFKVMSPPVDNIETEIKYKSRLLISLKVLVSVRFYASQWRSFLGLLPGLLFKLLIVRNDLNFFENQNISSAKEPHKGKLMSEYRYGVRFENQKEIIRKFLND
jgi:hypothetical protein